MAGPRATPVQQTSLAATAMLAASAVQPAERVASPQSAPSTTTNAPAIETPIATAPVTAARTAFELGLLGCLWGASFMFQRVAAPEFGAVPLTELRLLSGALVLLPFVYAARRLLRPYLLKLAAIGLLNSAVPFVLFAWAAARAPAAIGAITNSMAALFAVLVAWMMFGERIGSRRAIGLAAGFAGVIVLAGGKSAGVDTAAAALAGVVAALCYGIAGNLVKRWLTGLPPFAMAAMTLFFSAMMLAPLAVLQWPQALPSGHAWLSALLLGVLCTGAAYALYFRLIARIGPARAATVTYLVPLFGVTWAWAVLGEPLTSSMAFAGVLILGGVALSQVKATTVVAASRPETPASVTAPARC